MSRYKSRRLKKKIKKERAKEKSWWIQALWEPGQPLKRASEGDRYGHGLWGLRVGSYADLGLIH